jgi:hypothetical protein
MAERILDACGDANAEKVTNQDSSPTERERCVMDEYGE